MDIETLIEKINSGVFDDDLGKIRLAAEERLGAIRGKQKNHDFKVGEHVIFNSLTGTRYMVGQKGVVDSLKNTKVVVRLDAPTGRFLRFGPDGAQKVVRVTAAVSILDKI